MRRIAAIVLLALVCAAALTACTSPRQVSSSPPASGVTAPFTPTAAPGGPVRVHDPGVVTGTLTGSCRVTGKIPDQLPDPRCTPGSYDPVMTAARICAPGYSTRSYRAAETGPHGTTRFKYGEAYPAYGLTAGTRTELDHLISLELGGSNDAANLWPEQPPTPNPKDEVENELHAWVCAAAGQAAQTRLALAQAAIAADWVTAAQLITSSVQASTAPA